MRIISVSFRKLVTGPGYSNKAVEATAEIEPGEDAELCLIDLRQWVEKQLGERAIIADPVQIRQELTWLYDERDRANRELKTAEANLQAIRDKIAKTHSSSADDDKMPF
jgi:hypothetical protein